MLLNIHETFLAPLCPTPPDVKVEGIKEYNPLPIPMTPEKICTIDSENVDLKCPSFLDIYITKIVYGRNQSTGKVICDGEKPNDFQQPNGDCFDETYNNQLRLEMAEACHGIHNCNYTIPTVPLTSVCDGLKREVKIEYICGRWFWFVQ